MEGEISKSFLQPGDIYLSCSGPGKGQITQLRQIGDQFDPFRSGILMPTVSSAVYTLPMVFLGKGDGNIGYGIKFRDLRLFWGL